MSKTISYKGTLPTGDQERIKLSTLNGKTGYRIKKFKTISSAPGSSDIEIITKIYKKEQSNITPTIDFTEGDLLACCHLQGGNVTSENSQEIIIFDNEVFNQNIFITADDEAGGTTAVNYYLELEAMPISDLEATQLTLKSLRTISE